MNRNAGAWDLLKSKKWFIRPLPKSTPSVRLICLPYAGGNAVSYFPWAAHLPREVELIAVQPPGRGTRMAEAPYSEMAPLVRELLSVLPAVIDRPYVLFGHSLGSRIAFELALQCQHAGMRLPACFIASGSRAPHLQTSELPIHDLPQAEFVDKLRELNGTPEVILSNTELIRLLTPLLRADFKIAAQYCAAQAQLDCPMVVLGGTEDDDVSREELDRWRELSTSGCVVHWIPGGHFFIEQNRAQVLERINSIIAPIIARAAGSALPAADSGDLGLPPGEHPAG